MAFNIYFQIAALLVALICGYFCLVQKRLNICSDRQFLRLVSGIILSIFFDIVSVVAIAEVDSLGENVTSVLCAVYLVSIALVAYFALGFACVDVDFVQHGVIAKSFILPVIAEVLAVIVFPVKINYDPVYTYGTAVIATYVISIFYIVAAVLIVIFNRDKVYARKRRTIYGWFGTWFLAAAIQFLNNELLLVSFAMSLGCMYIYVKFQNPENLLDIGLNIFNRKAFNVAVDEDIKGGKHKSVVAFEIYNTNPISEIFGNKTLRLLIAQISDYGRSLKGGVEFRLDSNMFGLIVSDEERLESIVEELERRFKKPWEVNDTQVIANVGITYIRDILNVGSADDIEEMLHFFSNKLMKSNQSYLEINEEALKARKRSSEVQHALDWALLNEGVEMYYQPIYGIKEGRFTALEALVRIRDEQGNLIMPGEFVEFAEKNGVILKLGEEIFRQVCRFIKKNRIEDYGIEYIEVNLSVVQCMQDDLAKTFTYIMAEYQIPPHQINFEITETAAINTRETLESNMSAFIGYGNTFSLDDYGSGYSNLTYIVEMPLKIIKIDRSLTIAYDKSEKARIATEYTVEMVHKLGMEIVVEGIETEEQYMNFKKLGVEFIQGYYFSKPLPSDRVLNYVREWL